MEWFLKAYSFSKVHITMATSQQQVMPSSIHIDALIASFNDKEVDEDLPELIVYITHVLTKLTEKKYIFGLAMCVQVWFVVRTA
jgi:hypothetical protein